MLAAGWATIRTDDRAGPLAGVRVLELGSFIAGPFSGQLLGDYGAEIIKVEPPGDGDPMRRWGVTRDGDSLWWPAIARNKRSVTLDLRDERARAVVRRLAAACDIVIENFRPVASTSGASATTCWPTANPAVVLVHISGFGQTGPRAGEAGFGSIGEAVGGIRHTTGSPDRPPSRAGISLGDALAAMFGVIGALAALTEARRTGRGQEVDVAIYEAVAALMESSMADLELGGVLRGRSGSVLPGRGAVERVPDGRRLRGGDRRQRRLGLRPPVPGHGSARAGTDERYATHGARGANMAELDELIGGVDGDAAGGDAARACWSAHGVPAGQIFTAREMLTDPQYQAREMVQRHLSYQGWEVPMTGIVPRFTRTPGAVRHTGQPLGHDTDAVLREVAGCTDDELDELAKAGLI